MNKKNQKNQKKKNQKKKSQKRKNQKIQKRNQNPVHLLQRKSKKIIILLFKWRNELITFDIRQVKFFGPPKSLSAQIVGLIKIGEGFNRHYVIFKDYLFIYSFFKKNLIQWKINK